MALFGRRKGGIGGRAAPGPLRSPRVRPRPSEPVEVHIMGGRSLDILHARNVSDTGLGVWVPHRFEGCDLDEEMTLVITLPRRRSFVARGTLKHVTSREAGPGHFGVEFTALAERHCEAIRDYVREIGGDPEPG